MESDIAAIPTAEADPERPVYHFRPPANWNNDPNGTIWYKGWHHLFYQHNPYGSTWGHMHWGHARSIDLVNWEHLPIALWPSIEKGEEHVYSGAAKYAGNPILSLKIHGNRKISDNRLLLPPFLPVERNSDGIFGLMLQKCVDDSHVSFLPWILLHSAILRAGRNVGRRRGRADGRPEPNWVTWVNTCRGWVRWTTRTLRGPSAPCSNFATSRSSRPFTASFTPPESRQASGPTM